MKMYEKVCVHNEVFVFRKKHISLSMKVLWRNIVACFRTLMQLKSNEQETSSQNSWIIS